MDSPPSSTRVVVIGAGQAGLSVAYYLQRLGLEPAADFVVLDRGPATGGAWQHRWDALTLGSAHRVADLPGMAELDLSFETADRTRPAREVVAEYYARYEEHYGLRVARPVRVTRVADADLALSVSYATPDAVGDIRTDTLVNATGTWGAPFVPHYPGAEAFAGEHVHTATYRGAEQYRGKRVVVVGGGTSAIGFLLELEGVAAELTWASRRPIDFVDGDGLSMSAAVNAVTEQDVAARAGAALPSIVSGTGVPRTRRVAAGIERGVLVARPMFERILPHGIRWADGTEQEADVILWATGFRPELRHLAALKLREKEGGIAVGNGASWTDPRVFFAGYGPQASTIGANRAGRAIARQVVAMLSSIGL